MVIVKYEEQNGAAKKMCGSCKYLFFYFAFWIHALWIPSSDMLKMLRIYTKCKCNLCDRYVCPAPKRLNICISLNKFFINTLLVCVLHYTQIKLIVCKLL